jgi:hypothetical protein
MKHDALLTRGELRARGELRDVPLEYRKAEARRSSGLEEALELLLEGGLDLPLEDRERKPKL